MFRRFLIKSTLRLRKNVKIANQRSPFPQEVRKLIIKSAQRVYKMCILLNKKKKKKKIKLVSIIFFPTARNPAEGEANQLECGE